MKIIKQTIASIMVFSLCLTPLFVHKVQAKHKYGFSVLCIDRRGLYTPKGTLFQPTYLPHPLKANIFFKKKKVVKGITKYQYNPNKKIGTLSPRYLNCAVKSVHLRGYKNNKPLKRGEYVDEKYITNGTLVYGYKKIKAKKPKVKFTTIASKDVNGKITDTGVKAVVNVKNRAFIAGGDLQVKPVYFSNTTGKGMSKMTPLKLDSLVTRTKENMPGNFSMLMFAKGTYKTIKAFKCSMTLVCYDAKIINSSGGIHIVKKRYKYNGTCIVHKNAPKKQAKEKIVKQGVIVTNASHN